MEIEDDQKEPGTIVQEVQKGFMIKEVCSTYNLLL